MREVYFEGPNRVRRALKTSILNTDWLAGGQVMEGNGGRQRWKGGGVLIQLQTLHPNRKKQEVRYSP